MRRRMLLAVTALALAVPAAPAMADPPKNSATAVASNVNVTVQKVSQTGFFSSQFNSQSSFTNQSANAFANAQQTAIDTGP
jgi:hypothetical protein